MDLHVFVRQDTQEFIANSVCALLLLLTIINRALFSLVTTDEWTIVKDCMSYIIMTILESQLAAVLVEP